MAGTVVSFLMRQHAWMQELNNSLDFSVGFPKYCPLL